MTESANLLGLTSEDHTQELELTVLMPCLNESDAIVD